VSTAIVTAAPPPLENRLGFYGKLPTHGDFVTRRLPRSFTEPWDAWLQAGLARAQTAQGESWLESYLNAPLWRFVLAPGVCGDTAMTGVLMPSIDRVGRYFPLTFAVALGSVAAPARMALAAGDWYKGVEDLALSILSDEPDYEDFNRSGEAIMAPGAETAGARVSAGGEIFCALGMPDAASDAALELADGLFNLMASWAIWWTTGSEQIKGTFIVTKGLPSAEKFAALLDGQWERWGWKTP